MIKKVRGEQHYVLDGSLNDDSWFTRNAADHARGTAPARCFAPCLLDRAEGAHECVMSLSVVMIKLSRRSTNLEFSEDDW